MDPRKMLVRKIMGRIPGAAPAPRGPGQARALSGGAAIPKLGAPPVMPWGSTPKIKGKLYL